MSGSRLLLSNVDLGAAIGPNFVGTSGEGRRRPGNTGESEVVFQNSIVTHADIPP
jgi:hypothetical protein